MVRDVRDARRFAPISFVTPAALLRVRFDDGIYNGKDLYNTDFCLQVLEKGYKIAIADILLHQAKRPENMADSKEWNDERTKTLEKWSKYDLPITINSFDSFTTSPEIVRVEI